MRLFKKYLLLLLVFCGLLPAAKGATFDSINSTLSTAWSMVFGTASDTSDFLIYDATCSTVNPAIYLVGKAENKQIFASKPRLSEDAKSDAFLACVSLDGDLLWSLTLPCEENYYNAFATTIAYTQKNTLLIMSNAYDVKESIESTRSLIPRCTGKLFLYEYSLDGSLIAYKKNGVVINSSLQTSAFLPRITKIVDSTLQPDPTYFAVGYGLMDKVCTRDNPSPNGNYSYYLHSSFVQEPVSIDYNGLFIMWDFMPWYQLQVWDYLSFYPLSRDFFSIISLYKELDKVNLLCKNQIISYYPPEKNISDTTYSHVLYSRGIDLTFISYLFERWETTTEYHDGKFQNYARPQGTFSTSYKKSIFPGTVLNVHPYQNKFLVQGIHCRNYTNRFFKKGNDNYAYSHDTNVLQKRNAEFATVPYMVLYDSNALYSKIPDSVSNYVVPYRWASFFDVDWYYEDIFHVADSAQTKDVYQPYEPIVCSAGDRVFLIGNARKIGNSVLRSYGSSAYKGPVNDTTAHHQGFILALQPCPPDYPPLVCERFLCPGDSLKIALPKGYENYRFAWNDRFTQNNALAPSQDSTYVFVKAEGRYQAILKSLEPGCPDLQTDTLKIRLSPYPEPQADLPHDTIATCAMASVPLRAATQEDSSFSYRWHDQDSVYAKAVRFSGDSIFWAKVDVSGYCTSFRDSAVIRFLPPYVNLGEDSVLCFFINAHNPLPHDTVVLKPLTALQDYFPSADWFYRWYVNGNYVGNNTALVARYGDLLTMENGGRKAEYVIRVSLSDTTSAACTATDTLRVSLFSLPDASKNVFLPQDSVLCAHLDLDLPLPVESSLFRCFWLDKDSIVLPGGGDTNRFVIAGMRGIDSLGGGTDTRVPRLFQLRLQHRYCNISYFDSITVFDLVKPTLELPWHDSLICRGNPIEMEVQKPHVYLPFYQFLWNSGEKDANRKFTDSGTYVLMFAVKDSFNFCKYVAASDTVRIQAPALELTNIALPSDTTFCEKLSVTFDASVPFPSTRYSWQSGTIDGLEPPTLADTVNDTLFTSPIRRFDKSSTFVIFLLDTMGCVNAHQLNVTTEDCKPLLEIPNVFTPNGDGVNDVLKFKQIEKCYNVDILIVDRKGTRVLDKKLKNPDEFEWNGCFNNGSRKLPDGAYFYFISYKDAYGRRKSQSGSITILGSRE